MSKLYPLLFHPIFKGRVWGGRALEQYGPLPPGPMGEAWILGEHLQGTNMVANGPYEGLSLTEVRERHGAALVGSNKKAGVAGRFPLLFKLLDACDNLSVQVHPDDGDPHLPPGEFGKTEMWYVLSARPGSRVVYGLKDGVSREDIRRAVEGNNLEASLNFAEAPKGASFLVPAGLVHALGSGLVVAEIQQSSDTTYRLYDYGRVGLDGKPRELHVERALESIRQPEPLPRPLVATESEDSWVALALSAHFIVEKRSVIKSFTQQVNPISFEVLLPVGGCGTLQWEEGTLPLQPGKPVLVPASLGQYSVSGPVEILRTRLPGE